MARGLKKYFPTIRTKGEILQEIRQNKELNDLFDSWKEEHQREFLDFTSGMKGVKVLYDSFFKEIFNPEFRVPEDWVHVSRLTLRLLFGRLAFAAIQADSKHKGGHVQL